MTKFDFHSVSINATRDSRLRGAIGPATLRQSLGRQSRLRELPHSNELRELAGQIKQHALDHLDYYLGQLCTNVERNGGHIHFAPTAEDAHRIIIDIARAAGVSRCIKSKSMVSEEINLVPHLESAGIEVVETDLGEFIVQISGDRPSHLVAPIIHKDRASIAKLFREFFSIDCPDDPKSLTLLARKYLREKFRTSDFGMTGGNFLVAETGQVCCVENEGNQRQSLTTPRVLVSLVGIEKVIPRMNDLAVMLKLLARSATGQPITIYTNLFGGPRAPGERDGPEEFHLVLIDNGRTRILADPEYRETLRCIRCGACLNVCPIYRTIGGHSYGSVYPGPIGALITPLLNGLDEFRDLPQASSLCGACYEACPVKIDIPKHLINLRRDVQQKRLTGRIERAMLRLFAWSLRSPVLYRISSAIQGMMLRKRARDGWVTSAPLAARGWTIARDLPAPAARSFHSLWRERERTR